MCRDILLWLNPVTEADYPLPMRKSLVPQTGQTPWVAGRLFFRVTAFGFLISLLVLHFMQYACISAPP
jgi:hypothetical protein